MNKKKSIITLSTILSLLVLLFLIAVALTYYLGGNYYIKYKFNNIARRFNLKCSLQSTDFGLSKTKIGNITCIDPVGNISKIKRIIVDYNPADIFKDTVEIKISIEYGDISVDLDKIFQKHKKIIKNKKSSYKIVYLKTKSINFDLNYKNNKLLMEESDIYFKKIEDFTFDAANLKLDIKNNPLLLKNISLQRDGDILNIEGEDINFKLRGDFLSKISKLLFNNYNEKNQDKTNDKKIISLILSKIPPVINVKGKDGNITLLEGGEILTTLNLKLDSWELKRNTQKGDKISGKINFGIEGEKKSIGSVEFNRGDDNYIKAKINSFPIYSLFRCDSKQRLCVEKNSLLNIEGSIIKLDQDNWKVDGELKLGPISLLSSLVSSEPIKNLNLNIITHGNIFPQKKQWDFSSLLVNFNDIPVELEGSLIIPQTSKTKLNLKAKMLPAKCNFLQNKIPPQLLGNLVQMEFAGYIGFDAQFIFDMENLDNTFLDINVYNKCQVINPAIAEPQFLRQPFTIVIPINEDKELYELNTGPGSENWSSIIEIPQYIIHGLLCTEDGRFYKHHGFSLSDIRDAFIQNVREKRVVRGASTITMQVAKNLYLTQERTISRKFQEIFYTWWLETNFTKDEIMELYLNIIEFGPLIYGIKNASYQYFGKSPSELNLLEAVFLVKLIPQPYKRGYKFWEKGTITPQWQRNLIQTLQVMLERGYITSEEFEEAKNQNLIFSSNLPEPEPQPDFEAESEY